MSNYCPICLERIHSNKTMCDLCSLMPEKEQANTKEVLELDIDVVRMLRRTGRTNEANELLEAFHKSLEDNRVQGRREIANIKSKELALIKRRYAIKKREEKKDGLGMQDKES